MAVTNVILLIVVYLYRINSLHYTPDCLSSCICCTAAVAVDTSAAVGGGGGGPAVVCGGPGKFEGGGLTTAGLCWEI